MAKLQQPCSAADEQTASHVRERRALSGHRYNRTNEEQQPISHFLVDRVGKDALDSLKHPSKVRIWLSVYSPGLCQAILSVSNNGGTHETI